MGNDGLGCVVGRPGIPLMGRVPLDAKNISTAPTVPLRN